MKLDWGKSIFLFFVLFITLAAVFIVFSFKHKPELVTKNYYEEGAAYTEQINTNKRSAIYVDSIQILQKEESLLFSFSEDLRNNTDSLIIHLYCPADKNKDFSSRIKLEADSIVIPKNQISHGRYIAKIYWQMNNENYYLEKDLFVKH